MENPFSISFGRKPVEVIARPLQENEIIDAFSAQKINQQIFIITGVRGSGKTVLMTEVSNRLQTDDDWIVLELNPETDLLEDLVSKLASIKTCAEIFRNAKINLSFFGFGVEFQAEPPIRNLETALTRMLESLQKQEKRVLVTIDEATNSPSMRTFAAAFQILIRRNLPVFLLMTGLFENIDDLQNEKSLTFLYRAPKVQLSPLNRSAIASRYESLFHLSREEAVKMANLTAGFPFAFQALGYLSWQNGGNYQDVQELYRVYLEDYVYDKLWSEMSAKDKRLAKAIADSPDGKTKEVLEILQIAPNELSPYRKRLIKKGIIDGSERGRMSFCLPLFDAFVRDQYLPV